MEKVRDSLLKQKKEDWYVYILECKNGIFYIGITNNIQKRLYLHRSGKGARFTRGRNPITLVYLENCYDKRNALKREYEIKKYSKVKKIDLILKYSKKKL